MGLIREELQGEGGEWRGCLNVHSAGLSPFAACRPPPLAYPNPAPTSRPNFDEVLAKLLELRHQECGVTEPVKVGSRAGEGPDWEVG